VYIAATSSPNIFVPLFGPVGTNWATVPVTMAFQPNDIGEPATGDYKSATVIGQEAVHQVIAGDLGAGEYMIWVRMQVSPEDIRLPAGRLRVGDVR